MADLQNGTSSHPGARPKRGLSSRRLRRSFRFAYAGLRLAWTSQPNFRIEVVIGLLALVLSFWLGSGTVAVLLCAALVLTLEMLNSAIEAVVDLASPDLHPLAKTAKDLAAGAVLVSAGISVLVGLASMGPALLARLGLWP